MYQDASQAPGWDSFGRQMVVAAVAAVTTERKEDSLVDWKPRLDLLPQAAAIEMGSFGAVVDGFAGCPEVLVGDLTQDAVSQGQESAARRVACEESVAGE
jgi:hypothetical protein